jgi:hypothetical protein
MKMRRTDLRSILAVSAAFIFIAAYSHGAWASCTNPPAAARLLMAVPEDFERFVYESSLNGQHTRHMFGEQVMDELRAQLSPFFGTITVEHVDNEAAAKEMLDSKDYDRPDLGRYDLFAIPKFRNVDFWVKGEHYGFDIDLVVEFYPNDMSKVTRIRGLGESKTGFYADSTPGKSGALAVNKAVEAVADGLCQGGNILF